MKSAYTAVEGLGVHLMCIYKNAMSFTKVAYLVRLNTIGIAFKPNSKF